MVHRGELRERRGELGHALLQSLEVETFPVSGSRVLIRASGGETWMGGQQSLQRGWEGDRGRRSPATGRESALPLQRTYGRRAVIVRDIPEVPL